MGAAALSLCIILYHFVYFASMRLKKNLSGFIELRCPDPGLNCLDHIDMVYPTLLSETPLYPQIV